MPDSIKLLIAIARADVIFRFRKTTTIVLLLVVAGTMYLFVPDYHSGNSLMQIEGHRVIYNSEAIALGTAMLCSMLLSVIGYYLVSNSLKRDIVSRVGYIIAASPVTNGQYVLGKFFGSLLYLTGVMLACMVSAMIMFLIRGESMLNPFVFLETYTWAIFPGLIFASAAAIAFESFPKLSGRVGDVLFFFMWGASIGIPAAIRDKNPDLYWVQGFDIVGIVQIINQMGKQFHTESMSVGYSNYDITKPPIEFTGMEWSAADFGFRVMTLLLPLVLLGLAWVSFHRFNPVKIKSIVRHAKHSLLGRLNMVLKPVTQAVTALFAGNARNTTQTSFTNIVKSDMLATLVLSPIIPIAAVVIAPLSLVLDSGALQAGALPVIVVILIIALADIVTRDMHSGMMNLLFTMPHVKQNYVVWKLASAVAVTFCFTLVPIVKLTFSSPVAAVSVLIGSIFIASGAVGLGILTKNRKAFMGIFLMLLYITLNAADEPSLDFFGFYAKATPGVQAVYAGMSAALIAVTQVRYSRMLNKK